MLRLSLLLLTFNVILSAQDLATFENVRRDIEKAIDATARQNAANRLMSLSGVEESAGVKWATVLLDDEKAEWGLLSAVIQAIDTRSVTWRRVLQDTLKSPVNTRAHSSIATRLASTRDDTALQALVDAHRFGENTTKSAVIAVLGSHFDVDRFYVTVLNNHLNPQADPALRHESLRVLAQKKDRRFFKHLPGAFGKEPSVYRRADYITWCGGFDSHEGLLAMLPIILDKADPQIERALMGVALTMKSTEVTKWFRSQGAVSTERVIRLAAAKHLERNPKDGLSTLLTLSQDPDPEIAATALRGLSEIASDSAVRTLEQRLNHRDPTVAAEALVGLWQATKASDKTLATVKEIAQRSKSWELRLTALDLLRRDHVVSCRDIFLDNMNHERSQVRIAVYEALTNLREKSTVDVLIPRIAKEEGRAQIEVIAALFDLTNFDFGRSDEKWLKWWQGIREKFELPPKPLGKRTAGAEYATYYGVAVRSERICFLIDTSGSMTARVKSETRLDVTKDNLKGVVRTLNDRCKFNIIGFGSGLLNWNDLLTRSTPEANTRALQWIDALTASGGTNIYDALDRALEMPEVDTIFLLSDGAPSAGRIVDTRAIIEDISRRNRFTRIRINTILVSGDATTRTFMKTLATQNFGEFVETN